MTRDAFADACRKRWKRVENAATLRLDVARTVTSIPYPELEGSCLNAAGPYQARKPGEVVLVLLPHSVELFLLHVGLVLQGQCPAILAWPTSRVDPEKYARNLVHQLRFIPADRLLTIPDLAERLADSLPYPIESCALSSASRDVEMFSGFATTSDRASKAPPPVSQRPLPDGTLFLQFSGGTTGAQKCVPVTANMLTGQLNRLRD